MRLNLDLFVNKELASGWIFPTENVLSFPKLILAIRDIYNLVHDSNLYCMQHLPFELT